MGQIEIYRFFECADCRYRWSVELELGGSTWAPAGGQQTDTCPNCGSREVKDVSPTAEELGGT